MESQAKISLDVIDEMEEVMEPLAPLEPVKPAAVAQTKVNANQDECTRDSDCVVVNCENCAPRV